MKRHTNAILLLLGLFLVVVVGIAVRSAVRTPHSPTRAGTLPAGELPLRIGYVQVLSGLPVYVAMDNGHFAEADVEASLHPYKSSDLVFTALSNGEVDAGLGGLAQALRESEENPGSIKIVAILYSSMCLVAANHPDAPTSIRDLEGSRLVCFPGSVFRKYMKEVLRAEGLDLEAIQIDPLPPSMHVKALDPEGDISAGAIFTLEPTGASAVLDGAGRYLTETDLFSKHFLDGDPFPGGCVAVSGEFLARHPGAEVAITGALLTALADIGRPAFEQASYLRAHTKLRSDLASDLRFEGAAVGADINRASLSLLRDHLERWGLLGADFHLSEVLDP